MTPAAVPPGIPPGVALAQDAWRLGLGAIRAMPNLFSGTFALLLAFELAFRSQHPPSDGWPDAAELLLGFANDVATDVIAASALVAVHRSVLLGEATDRPMWRLPPTYDRYLFWLVLLNMPFLLVIGLGVPVIGLGMLARQGYFVPVVVGLLLLLAGAVAVTLRLALLLPLSAMGAPAADWRTAWHASRGKTWRLLAAALLTFVPLEIGAALVEGLFRGVDGPAALALGALGAAAKALLWAAVGAALWSRLLQTYGGTLARLPVWR